ncbi:MAG TPA: ABC transporter permease [Polyangiaceae bacterium]|nr:ABC transporter permease [Polyangiaceae bacterium]
MEAEQSAPPGLFDRALRPIADVLDALGSLLLLTGQTLVWLIRPPYRISQLIFAMDFIGVQSIFIVSLTGIFSGMVLALQTVHSLRQFGAEGVVGAIVAISLTREISPVFTGLMVTARAGSAMAAEIGNMRVTEQIDALVTMSVSPVQYLLSPRLLAAVIVVPLLAVLYTCVGMVGAWLVAVDLLSVDPGIFISNIEKNLTVSDLSMGFIKSAVFGFLISAISCNQGFTASGGARGVGRATTRAVVQSAVAILVANYFITSWLTAI